ncbi:hypothetical protein GCM10023115_18920 [Pontixanthobacter gangjinensis]|uniref:Uncharacterized protein n=1 Tax=Pontixanthobacter gangjinensis TaxID=1028742 RepID=A0A6I4SPR4_9SPHN|nr:hypothetical protein [Pontixanthobacter gangjinensis]MXO57140.1 hypothetical protein [Pontixanthobacter gangjinensis]
MENPIEISAGCYQADLASIRGYAPISWHSLRQSVWLIGEKNIRIYEATTNIVHAGAALLLLVALAFFCFFVFAKVEPHQTEPAGHKIRAKQMSNFIYRATGTLILLALAIIGASHELFGEWAKEHSVTY